MCGIAGIWSRHGIAPSSIRLMSDNLIHRGPDNEGSWNDPDAGIALTHRRLSVIDPSPAGHQPMISPCGRYILSFNGEIYNHLALRAELEAEQPVAWRGRSDTETLLQWISRRGLRPALREAVGMFALALWDRRDRRLSLARDRIGEKPLYYGWAPGTIAFASELKALRALPGFRFDVAPDALALYLRHNFVPAPRSIFRNIFKVEPGVIVTLDASAREAPPPDVPSAASPGATPGVDCRRYWSLDEVVAERADETMDEDAAIAAMTARLEEAVRSQMVADVPVGAFLSGGIDSSAIVALMRDVAGSAVRTFTIGFAEQGFDEAPHARAVARHLGTEHHELYVDAEEVRGVIPALPHIYDEPFGDSSQLPTILLSRMTRRSVTVALSGDGGDELFCGYNRYLASRRAWRMAAAIPAVLRHSVGTAIATIPPHRWDHLQALPLVPSIPMFGIKVHKVARMLRTPLGTTDIYRESSEEWRDRLPMAASLSPAPFTETELSPGRTFEEQMMRWDMQTYLPNDILTKVDRASMASSLEVRVPFLDHRVVEQAWRTPMAFKKRAGQGKWLLRQILHRHVPPSLIDRPKAGFAIPVGQWLRGSLREWAEDLLQDTSLRADPLLDGPAVRQRWEQHLGGARDWTGSLWGILMYRMWSQPC